MRDFVESEGLPFLAHLLRRLSDEFVRGCEAWYPSIGVIAPTRTASTLRLLHRRGPQTITEIAAAIRQSHPLVITWVRQLDELHLVESHADPADHRRRLVSLTVEGEAQAAKMIAADRVFEQAYGTLMAEAGVDLLNPLWTIERLARQTPFAARLADAAAQLSEARSAAP